VETIAIYPDLISAQLARSLLEAEGIDTSIPDENIAGIDWQWSTALHGIRLQVAPNDVESATALLSTSGSESASDETIPTTQPTDLEQVERCPFCGSDLMGSGRWRRRGKALTMLVPILLLLWPLVLAFGPTYECLKCGRLWKDASDTKE
jgi:hypothetical protein